MRVKASRISWNAYHVQNNIIRTGQKEYRFFCQYGNKAVLSKIKDLLNDIAEHPYTGIGKPEAFKYELASKWSRRINAEHRIVYPVHDDMVEVYIFSMKYRFLPWSVGKF